MKIMVTVAVLTGCMGRKGLILEKNLCFRERNIAFLENTFTFPGKKLGSRYAFSWSSGPVVLWSFQPWILAYATKKIILGSKKFRRNEENMKKGSKEKQRSRTISR